MNYPLLYTELQKPGLVGLSAEEAAAKLNAPTIEQKHLVNKVDALNYLLTVNKIRTRLKDASVDGRYPKELRDRIDDFLLTITTYEETNFANFEGDTKTLVTVGILTQAEVDGFMALAVGYISPAQQVFGEEVTPHDVELARLQPEVEEVDALRLRVASSINRIQGHLAAIDEKHAKGESAAIPSWDDVTALWGQE